MKVGDTKNRLTLLETIKEKDCNGRTRTYGVYLYQNYPKPNLGEIKYDTSRKI